MLTDAQRAERSRDLVDRIADHTRAQPDRQGEVWLACPFCGKGQRHFSVSAKGANCFVCGPHSLRAVADALGVDTDRAYIAPARPEPAPRPPRPWQARAAEIAASLMHTPGCAQAWAAYKPLPADLAASRQLGYGIFPGGLWSQKTGRCEHPRLIVPIRRAGQVTGFRCRAVACQCDKWLSPGGSKLWLYDIENAEPGADLWVVENPIDALQLRARGYPAVATFGASIWNDDYTAAVVERQPRQVVVAGDNDAAGRGLNERVTRALTAAGIPCAAFPWPAGAPDGYDIGQMLA